MCGSVLVRGCSGMNLQSFLWFHADPESCAPPAACTDTNCDVCAVLNTCTDCATSFVLQADATCAATCATGTGGPATETVACEGVVHGCMLYTCAVTFLIVSATL